jgi:nucleoid DNA-binding protein
MGRITDLALFLANKHGMKQKDAEKFISQMFDLLSEVLDEEKQVKVKGLGTFKVTSVKDRASVNVNTGERIIIEGRDKISFTPDASMKNLVNKPFAQFETVVLKDGVDFGEIDKKYNIDETTDETVDNTETNEIESTPEPTVSEPVVSESVTPEPVVSEPVVSEPEAPIPVVTEPVKVKEESDEIETLNDGVIEETAEESKDEGAVSAAAMSIPVQTLNEEELEDEEEMKRSEELAQKLNRTNNIVKALCAAIAILLLLGIYGIYSMNSKLNEKDQQIQQFVQAKQQEEEKAKAEELKLAKELEAYNNYDERVKNGDYKIVGIEKEVTAVQGQTLKSISRMELGPGMDCYVQAVNPDIKMVLIGQQVKIPKLEHK